MSDQEALQEWWQRYGKVVLLVLGIFLTMILGWHYGHKHALKQTTRASVTFLQLLQAEATQPEQCQLFAEHLQHYYPRSPYASLAMLMLAKQAVTKHDFKLAANHLQWVIKHTSSHSLRQVAKLRAARLANLQRQPKQALELLQHLDDSAYRGLVLEIQGDSYYLIGEVARARQAYQEAVALGVTPTLIAKIAVGG